MRRLYKIIRALLITIITLAIVVPVGLFIALSLPGVQDAIRQKMEQELSKKLDAEVVIGDLGIKPFNRVILRDVAVMCDGDTVLKAGRIGASVDIYESLTGKITIKSAEIISPDIRVSRDSIGAPLNIAPIIAALTKKEPDKGPTIFDVRVNSLIVRGGSASYDVKNLPDSTPGHFNRNHIAVSGLQADINLPRVSNDNVDINIKRLALSEKSGLAVTDISGNIAVDIANEGVGWRNIDIALPGSRILPADGSLSMMKALGAYIGTNDIAFEILPGSHLCLDDVVPLVDFPPEMDGTTFDFSFSVAGNAKTASLTWLNLAARDNSVRVVAPSVKVRNPLDIESMSYEIPDIDIALGATTLRLLRSQGLLPSSMLNLASGLQLKASGRGTLHEGAFKATGRADDGTADISVTYLRPTDTPQSPLSVTGYLTASNLPINKLIGNNDFGNLNGRLDFKALLSHKQLSGDIDASLSGFSYRGSTYDDLTLKANYNNGTLVASAMLDGLEGGYISADIDVLASSRHLSDIDHINARISLEDVNLDALGLSSGNFGHIFSGDAEVKLAGNFLEKPLGHIAVTDFSLSAIDGSRYLDIDNLLLTAEENSITIESDYINGSIEGEYNFATLPGQLFEIVLSGFMPASPFGFDDFAVAESDDDEAIDISGLFATMEEDEEFGDDEDDEAPNRFTFNFRIEPNEAISSFLGKSDIGMLPVTIEGSVDNRRLFADLAIIAPRIGMGNGKIIRETAINAVVDGMHRRPTALNATTSLPTADGYMKVDLNAKPLSSELGVATDLAWRIDRARRYDGKLSFETTLDEDDEGHNAIATRVLPSEMAFNDSVWRIEPGAIYIYRNHEGDTPGTRIFVDNLHGTRGNQSVSINGYVSADSTDILTVNVARLQLLDIFEALNIEAMMLGGEATGVITASNLLSHEPRIITLGDGIDVDGISYNRCVFGSAVVKSRWNNDSRSINIFGDISSPEKKKSWIDVELYPMSSEFDLKLSADSVPLGFLQPYFKAFAKDITGRGSGSGRLYGTFKNINMEGTFVADSLRLRLLATNTFYSASDTIRLRPDTIEVRKVTIRDPYGQTGVLNGIVTHNCFRDPCFNFTIKDVDNMLVYDTKPSVDYNWYGRIFANGSAEIIGDPSTARISIKAKTFSDITSHRESKFYFVLSDREVADAYDFIEFRDKAAANAPTTIDFDVDETEIFESRYGRKTNTNVAKPYNYDISISAEIDPQSKIILVMDPATGDAIVSSGTGAMTMDYRSADNYLNMTGTYTIDEGDYTFTLQKFIIKKFSIDRGSNIKFTGNPMEAELDIHARHRLTADITALDESFAAEVNKTDVPVDVVINIGGNIQETNITYGIEFPTLSSDVARKVNSILSTPEMISQQVLYLLVIESFYTPDYMSGSSGNELFSVASSTISSQLRNILGHISDKIDIAPKLRSSRGDFSDVEVDVYLSSRLLNNRLLLNGNFGYRDKSLNTNRFIGDFDLEYLLTPSGTIRFKAFSHSNEDNYYTLRTAQTTQGLGFLFRFDFDNLNFLLPRREKASTIPASPEVVPADTIPADSLNQGHD